MGEAWRTKRGRVVVEALMAFSLLDYVCTASFHRIGSEVNHKKMYPFIWPPLLEVTYFLLDRTKHQSTRCLSMGNYRGKKSFKCA
jgi:hypothetical protein